MKHSVFPYLTLSGIPAEAPNQAGKVFFMWEPQGTWYPSCGDFLYDIDVACIRLHDAFAERVFESSANYYEFLKFFPEFLSTAGMNSEAPISKNLFVQILGILPPDMPVNKALYLFDCQKLVSSVQGCSREVLQLQGEFYKVLNLEELFFSTKIAEKDGIRYVTSPVVTKLYALLGFVYIRLHSLLDYVTKLAIEIENSKTQFDSYPRLASKNCLYSDRKKVSLNKRQGTLFESCPLLTEVETVRNHLIHDGLLDDTPKVYRVISKGECVEKFLLFPDRCEEGRFDAFKNRSLFYGNEDKINLRLPYLVKEFQVRLLATLKLLLAGFDETKSGVGTKDG